jgi:hypothetical protein
MVQDVLATKNNNRIQLIEQQQQKLTAGRTNNVDRFKKPKKMEKRQSRTLGVIAGNEVFYNSRILRLQDRYNCPTTRG